MPNVIVAVQFKESETQPHQDLARTVPKLILLTATTRTRGERRGGTGVAARGARQRRAAAARGSGARRRSAARRRTGGARQRRAAPVRCAAAAGAAGIGSVAGAETAAAAAGTGAGTDTGGARPESAPVLGRNRQRRTPESAAARLWRQRRAAAGRARWQHLRGVGIGTAPAWAARGRGQRRVQ
jgi:hypothetical protein